MHYWLFGALALSSSSVWASQTPFNTNAGTWDLNLEPNVNSTGHLIFDTVSAFLQHWPNTRYRNGMWRPLASSPHLC